MEDDNRTSVSPIIIASVIASSIAVVIGVFLGIYFSRNNVWTGFYYSDLDRIDDQRTWIISPPLYSLDECRDWVNTVRKDGDNYDYSCGQGCRFTKKIEGETILCNTDTK